MLRCLLVVLASTGFFLIAGLSASPGHAQTKIPRVGVLVINSSQDVEVQQFLEPLPRTLSAHGWVAGKNVIFEFRDAGGDPTRMKDPVAELVRERVDVLFPVGPPSVRAAFAATQDIPIVAHDLETDPVAAGYARSYSRPSRNLTGLFLDSPDLAGKWLELLKALVPRLSRVVVLWDATSGPVALGAVNKAGAELASSWRYSRSTPRRISTKRHLRLADTRRL